MDKLALFILNIFINSFLMFFTVAILIEGIIFLFRIRQGRFAAILRMIPIVKLPLDLFLYDFSRWSYSHGINPWMCEEGTRNLSVMFGCMNAVTDRLLLPITSGIQMTVAESMTFTIADVIGQSLNPFFLTIFSLFFILCSLRWVIKKLTLYCRSTHVIYPLVKEQQYKNRTIRNSSLKAYCKKVQFQIVTTSSFSGSPFVAGLTSPIIYIPEPIPIISPSRNI